MEHKKISRWLLGAGGAAIIGAAFIFLVYLLGILQLRQHMSAYVLLLVLLGMCGLALAYGLALYEYMRICIRIGRNQSFCRENARGLGRIGRYLFLAAGIWLMAQGAALLPDVGPGSWWISFLLFAAASAAMGVLAWAMGKLLSRAVELKEENDLTV